MRLANRWVSGFTLIELLLVLTLVSFLVLLVPPAVTQSKGFHRADLKKTARELVSALRYTRSVAISRAHAEELELDVEQGKVRYPGMSSGQWRSLAQMKIQFIAAKSGMRDNSTAAVRFFPDGSSSGGRIRISQNGQSYTIDVSWLTGRVSVSKGGSV